MPSLRDVQRAFAHAVLSGDAGDMVQLVRDDGIPAAKRVQIYSNNQRAAFLAALAATYPVIARLGGEDWFAQSVAQYMQRFPSRCGDLQFAGDRFAQFLSVDLADTNYAYFADVARLEWAYQEVLTAAEHAPLDPASLDAVTADDYARLILVPRPALRLVESRYPILAIWQANQAAANPEAPEVRLDAGASRVLVIRRADHVELRELAPASAALLKQLLHSIPLGIAADAVADNDFGGALQQLFALETLGAFHLCINQADHA
jgi:hypothetical protein